jgi:DNA sulfur modification protein DndE
MKSMLIKFWPFKLNSWLALYLFSFITALPVYSTAAPYTGGDSVILLAKQAYVYGFPLVMMYETERSAVNHQEQTWGSVFAPINQFGHFRAFPDATFRGVVKPNCDTYYSSAWLDLAQEPLVLTLPDTKGRFYLLQMMDAYTNVFASPGKRTTGTAAQTILITGPAYTGTVPVGMSQIKAPTNMVWILGRTQVNSATDGKEVVYKIQDGYTLTPLSKWGSKYQPAKGVVDSSIGRNPSAFVEGMDISTFFTVLNDQLARNPPPAADSTILRKIAAIGVGPRKQFNLGAFDSETQAAIKTIPANIQQQLRFFSTKAGSIENGWNISRKGLGTYGTNYRIRALIALIALGANLNADASYPICQSDADGNKFDGLKKYSIHFDKGQTPPANAFWSLTMYGPDDFLVANPIQRYSIGDRSSLKYNPDGSLDIFIQNEQPANDKEANWLPAPKGSFTLTMRIYWPKESFLDGSWKIPAVKMANDQ